MHNQLAGDAILSPDFYAHIRVNTLINFSARRELQITGNFEQTTLAIYILSADTCND